MSMDTRNSRLSCKVLTTAHDPDGQKSDRGQEVKNTSLESLGMEESDHAKALDGPEENFETYWI